MSRSRALLLLAISCFSFLGTFLFLERGSSGRGISPHETAQATRDVSNLTVSRSVSEGMASTQRQLGGPFPSALTPDDVGAGTDSSRPSAANKDAAIRDRPSGRFSAQPSGVEHSSATAVVAPDPFVLSANEDRVSPSVYRNCLLSGSADVPYCQDVTSALRELSGAPVESAWSKDARRTVLEWLEQRPNTAYSVRRFNCGSTVCIGEVTALGQRLDNLTYREGLELSVDLEVIAYAHERNAGPERTVVSVFVVRPKRI